MDIRSLTPDYAVSPQIDPQDCSAIAEAGFTDIICNRPDGENPAHLQASELQAAAQAAGLQFHILPITHQTMTPEAVAQQAQIRQAAKGPVLAYCASGTRSSIMWALAQVPDMPADEILATAQRAGYDLSGLRGALGD